MHAEKLLHKWLSNVLPEMHAGRLRALGAVVSGALRGGRLTVTSLGRALRSSAKEKHNIKRADRLLANPHLRSERIEIYSHIASQVIGNERRPIILIDWSDVDPRREYFILRAATPVKGRSLTLYEEVHARPTRERRTTHNEFLENLESILPENCTPIIVTDAGFRTPWFKKVKALGWDFVGRVRNREMLADAKNRQWISGKSIYAQATSTPQVLQQSLLTRSNPLSCNLILYKSTHKGRVCRGKMGRVSRSRTSLVNSERAREPWLLTTSLNEAPQEIVSVYSTRMQIEESFRDLKCPRYGLSLYFTSTYKLARLQILVLIGTLAATFAWLLGSVAQQAKLARHFQANTIRHCTVLSVIFLGLRIFRKNCFRLSISTFTRINNLFPCLITANENS